MWVSFQFSFSLQQLRLSLVALGFCGGDVGCRLRNAPLSIALSLLKTQVRFFNAALEYIELETSLLLLLLSRRNSRLSFPRLSLNFSPLSGF
jgi:hypothetical protein